MRSVSTEQRAALTLPHNERTLSSLWTWLPYRKVGSFETMELDRLLFERVRKNEHLPYLRFYQWETRTVSFGRTHGMEHEPVAQLEADGWSVVKRPTGGGTVLHQNDLCFSIVWHKEGGTIPWTISQSYLAIHKFVRNALQKMGLEPEFHKEEMDSQYYGNQLCFKNPVCSDLMLGGKKIVGGAQWRSHDTALHQGSIQLAIDPKDLGLFKSAFESQFNVRFAEDAELSQC